MDQRSGEDHMDVTMDEGAAGLAKSQARAARVSPSQGQSAARLYGKRSRCSPGP
jgi:hypothetical protein